MGEIEAVWTLLQRLKDCGFTPTMLSTGDSAQRIKSTVEARDEIMALDLCRVSFIHDSGHGGSWALFVRGNDPCEIVADYGYTDQDHPFHWVSRVFDEIITTHSKEVESNA